ncbi:MAG: flagellar basal body P-ring formation chaperone FlgA [Armatimonadota bacterium]|nr:flagellar basal body P-ring formation chaperone FlgA [Armatimonadota bacterium]
MRVPKSLMLILLLLLGSSVCSAEQSRSAVLKICLPARVEVQCAKPVKLGDVAKVQGPAYVVEKARAITIALGPLPARAVDLDSEQLRQRIQAELHFPVEINGARNTTLVGKSLCFKSAELAVFAKEYMQSQLTATGTSHYEVSVNRVPSDLIVAAGNSCELRARVLNPTVGSGPKLVAVDIVVDDRVSATTSVGLMVREFSQVLVSTRSIRQGETISPDNTCWEIRDITRIKSPIKPEAGCVDGWVAKRSIDAGTVLTIVDVAPAFVVRRGDTVSVNVKCGKVALHTVAEVKQDGRVGDLVRVRPSMSSQDIQARVVEPGVVTIEM